MTIKKNLYKTTATSVSFLHLQTLIFRKHTPFIYIRHRINHRINCIFRYLATWRHSFTVKLQYIIYPIMSKYPLIWFSKYKKTPFYTTTSCSLHEWHNCVKCVCVIRSISSWKIEMILYKWFYSLILFSVTIWSIWM